MSNPAIEASVLQVIRDCAYKSGAVGSITPNTIFGTIQGLDGLAFPEVMLALEERFNLEIPAALEDKYFPDGQIGAQKIGQFVAMVEEAVTLSVGPGMTVESLPKRQLSFLRFDRLFGSFFKPRQ